MMKATRLRKDKLKRLAMPIALLLTGAIGVIDTITGIHLRLFPLYFVPVALVASTRSRPWAVGASVVGTLVWAMANQDPEWPLTHLANACSQFIAFLCVSLLVNYQKVRADDHRKTASIDALTGLLNSRAFYVHAAEQLEKQSYSGTTLTLAYLDVDNFKQVNTALGHLGADEVLKGVATAMTLALRSSDVFARIGGDEFALLLPGATKVRAAEVLERVRKQVSETTSEHAIPITFSIGAVVFETPADAVSTMMKLSDALMYRVKNSSKDAVLVLSASELLAEDSSAS